jgi:hypothetical protein
MSQELIAVVIDGANIQTTADAQELASNLHNELSAIVTVIDAPSQAVAVGNATSAQKFLKELEACRKSVKAPVLELGRKIDRLADELAAPVKEQMDRVGKLVANFQRAELERVERERKAREEAEQKAMEEARKAAAEAAAKAKALQNEAELEAAIKAEAEAKAKEAEMYRTLTAPQPTAQKAAGSVTKKVLRYEVTDIHALYKAAPHLVKLDPNISAIKSICTPTTSLPGLRVWEELDTTFRSR